MSKYQPCMDYRTNMSAEQKGVEMFCQKVQNLDWSLLFRKLGFRAA